MRAVFPLLAKGESRSSAKRLTSDFASPILRFLGVRKAKPFFAEWKKKTTRRASIGNGTRALKQTQARVDMTQKREQLRIRAWAKTDVGRQRKHNEDNYIVDMDLGLFGVADGMGGHAAGEVASETALTVLRTTLEERIESLRALIEESPEKNRPKILNHIDEAVQAAAKSVYDMSKKKADARGMGTTLSMMMILGNKAVVGHVGDSRIFLLRQNQIFQLTEDHSLVKEQLRMGLITEEEAERSPYKNVITRAVGASDTVKVDTLFVDLHDGDRFLLCSDGLHGYFQEGEVGPHMAEEDIEKIPERLINLANERGGKDNITAILVWSGTDSPKSDKTKKTEITLRMDLLQKVPLFQHMTYQELVKVMNITYLKTYHKGERVVEEDEVGDVLYIIFKGKASVQRKGKQVAMLREGDHFGEMALVDKMPRSATVIIEDESQLLTITRKNFIELMRVEQSIAVKILWGFLKTMSSRLRNTTASLVDEIE